MTKLVAIVHASTALDMVKYGWSSGRTNGVTTTVVRDFASDEQAMRVGRDLQRDWKMRRPCVWGLEGVGV